uniref:Copper resistance protein B n=1 Tax=Candidatus Kentrum sp. LPFa TaxID=2126335 RepID=A0A450WIW3_9GAMM|nr:MAG: copper resistance protein B [Candidatus Kentron sp. LPFa]
MLKKRVKKTPIKNTLVAMMMVGISGAVLSGAMAAGMGTDDPLLYKVNIDRLEYRKADGHDPLAWEADAWIGRDLHKFRLKTEGERVDGDVGEFETQFLYSRAIAPFWDLQLGWRRDIKPTPNRDWLTVGFEGIAPYRIETDVGLFLGESGRIGLRLDAEYEYLITQRLVLSPEIEVNFHGKNDAEVGIGSNLSDLEFGLSLGYEIRREFAPYIGVNWERKFGKTADFARDEGEDSNDVQIVTGIRAWF